LNPSGSTTSGVQAANSKSFAFLARAALTGSDTFEEFLRLDSQRDGQPAKVLKADVAMAPLATANVRAIQARFVGESFLGQTGV
jgi:hypothetical protein